MSDPFIGEIRIFAGNYAPLGWALCQGQLMPINQNTGLYAVIGTYYGGDGRSTFALPDLRDRVPVHAGSDSNVPRPGGLATRFLGEIGGSSYVALVESEMPFHDHTLNASSLATNREGTKSPALAMPGRTPPIAAMYGTGQGATPLASVAITPTGGSLPHNNEMPSTVLNFCIALNGEFPTHG